MNYVVPLLVGAQDMAFPRLNAFAYWVAVPASVLLLMSLVLGGFDTGWTGYPPLSARAPVGMQMFFLGVFTAGWSSILGSLNVIATVIRMRAKGMTAMRLPIFVWASIATSIIALTATQLIGLSFQLVMFQRLLGHGLSSMPPKAGIRSCSSISSGSIRIRRYMCLCCPGLALSPNSCRCSSANPCLDIAGSPCLRWALRWWVSRFGRITCLPPA